MATNDTTQIMLQLRSPFKADRIEWRLQSCGTKKDGSIWAKCLAYIDNRAAMERLDEVFGANWSQEEQFQAIGSAAVCTVTITVDGVPGYPSRTVTGSAAVEANGDIDQFKSAASGAMKRAVVNLGVGRYLYSLPEAWAVISDQGTYSGKTKDGTWFKWDPPALPSWAVPEFDDSKSKADDSQADQDSQQAKPQQEWKPDPAKFKSNPNATSAPSAVAADPGDPWSVQIHFGKNKGIALRDLPENTLKWYSEKWEPKPYNGKISKNDLNLRAALDKIAGNGSVADAEPIPYPDQGEEVPF